jgi:hypothetical protein
VPDGIDSSRFKNWLPVPEPPNIRAPRWFLATSARECWRCGGRSCVFAIVLPPEHEALMVEDDPADDYWKRGWSSTLLSYVVDVAEPVAARLRRVAPRYRVDYSQTTHSLYWMNHCEHCDAKLGDFETMEGTRHLLRVRPHIRSEQPPSSLFMRDRGALYRIVWQPYRVGY